MILPWGGLGQTNLAENESHIYPNMCAKFVCGPTVVSKKGGGGGTDRQTKKTAALYRRCVGKHCVYVMFLIEQSGQPGICS